MAEAITVYDTAQGTVLGHGFWGAEPERSELQEGWRQLLCAVRAIEGRGGRVRVWLEGRNVWFSVKGGANA